jgi:hypothetical protein
MQRRDFVASAAMLVTFLTSGCGPQAAQSADPSPAATAAPARTATPSRAATPAPQPAASADAPPPSPESPRQTRIRVTESQGLFGGGGPRFPEGLVMGGDCPAPPADAAAEMAAQSAARVPLTTGLTLVTMWRRNVEEEYECTYHVTAVRPDGIELHDECQWPQSRGPILRLVCRSDLRTARMLHTQFGTVEVIGEDGELLPENIVGATSFSLSRDEFAELKKTGATSHHYVQIGGEDRLAVEARGTLRLEGTGTARIAVNGTPVDLPVVEASGEADMFAHGKTAKGRLKAVILDDEHFPMLVDYVHLWPGDPIPHFRLHFPKVTYPSGDTESELARRGRLVVHGIYFDFNSDRIRKESEPILKEIGDALARHPDWTLTVNGHTDNVGGNAYNLALSDRRAAAVRRALVERHGIAADRLRSAGFGASAPIEPNDTPEGRARNRRVELVRVEAAAGDSPRP